jgi:hypothetical protein
MDPAELIPGKAFSIEIFAEAARKAALFDGKAIENRVVVMFAAGRIAYDSMPFVLEQMRAAVEDERQRCAKIAKQIAAMYSRKKDVRVAEVVDEVNQRILSHK